MLLTAPNKLISEELLHVLKTEQKIKDAICSQLEGELIIFIRDGHVQKVRYQRDYMMTQADFFYDEEDEENATVSTNLISDVIYRRFTYLAASSILRIQDMEYGHLHFKYSFVEANSKIEVGDLAIRFDAEIHIPKDSFPKFM